MSYMYWFASDQRRLEDDRVEFAASVAMSVSKV